MLFSNTIYVKARNLGSTDRGPHFFARFFFGIRNYSETQKTRREENPMLGQNFVRVIFFSRHIFYLSKIILK